MSDSTVGLAVTSVSPPKSFVILDKKVMLVLPWGKFVNPLTAFSVAQLMDRRRTTTALNYGDAFVAHSRNSCADHFLSTELDWYLTIDDDMLVPFGNATWYNAHTGFNLPEKFAGLNTIDRLLSHGKTLVGGLYFGRHKHANPVYGEGAHTNEADYARTSPIDLIKPTKWVGTGCMLLHRKVFLDIEAKFPALARGVNGKGGNYFTSSEHTLLDSVNRTREMLSKGPMDGPKAMKAFEMLEAAASEAKSQSFLGMGEDVTFCRRASQSGHQPYVDMGLLLGHIGHCVYGAHNTSTKKTG